MTRPATAGDLMRVLASVPPDAELHVYVRGTTASVQAEWVDSDQHIQNPVVLRAAYELWGAAGAEVPQYAASTETAQGSSGPMDDSIQPDGSAGVR